MNTNKKHQHASPTKKLIVQDTDTGQSLPEKQILRAQPATKPAPAPDIRDLPHALTFFMTGCERLQILRALRRLDGNRVFALKRALGLA